MYSARTSQKRRGLLEHIRFVHKKGSASSTLVCDLCGKEFAKRNRLREHIRFVHKKEKNLCCEFCTKAFARKEALTRHIKDLHELSGNFACGFCDKKYSKSRDKIVHEKKHTGEKPYHCEKCDRGW